MLNVRVLMQSSPKTVRSDLSIPEFERLCMSSGFSGFPVVDGEELVGVVSRSDVLRSILTERSRAEQISDYYAQSMGADALEKSLESVAAQIGVRLEGQTVGDVMSHNVISIESDRSIQELARFMLEARVHRLPVVEEGRLVGVVTTMDIVRAVEEGTIVESDSPLVGRKLLDRTS